MDSPKGKLTPESDDDSRRHFFKLKLNALPGMKEWSDSDEEMETVRMKQSV